ncbi:hypothetical protein GPECTOR_4g970 [Gonium pectorale]|uniref:Uncharacterized protein n=1 Tax=Gonium pectorale TaxID=33097 RepID=A0A150GYZ5_GONPE|nr:hypothetical protein GPECTOR_4g970 [Gonium pectorale]|eukprot:KXZ54898.1 hypothetical protein GPECTOR_4g970 [Gonium pectorale]
MRRMWLQRVGQQSAGPAPWPFELCSTGLGQELPLWSGALVTDDSTPPPGAGDGAGDTVLQLSDDELWDFNASGCCAESGDDWSPLNVSLLDRVPSTAIRRAALKAAGAPESTAAVVRLAVHGLPPQWAAGWAEPAEASSVSGPLDIPAGVSVASWGSGVPSVPGAGSAADGGASSSTLLLAQLTPLPEAEPAPPFPVMPASAAAPAPARVPAPPGLDVAVRSAGRYLPVQWWWQLPQSRGGGGSGSGGNGVRPVLELAVTGVFGQGLLVVEVMARGTNSPALLPVMIPLDTTALQPARRLSLFTAALDRGFPRGRAASTSTTGGQASSSQITEGGGAAAIAGGASAGVVPRVSSVAAGLYLPPYTESEDLAVSSYLNTALFSSLALPSAAVPRSASAYGGTGLFSAFSGAGAGVMIGTSDATAASNDSDAGGGLRVSLLERGASAASAAEGAESTHGSAAAPGPGASAPPPAARCRRIFHDSAVDITVPILPGSLDLGTAMAAVQRGPVFGQRMQDLAVGLLAWLCHTGRPAAAGAVLQGLMRHRGMRFEQAWAEVRRLGAAVDGARAGAATAATPAAADGAGWGWAGMSLLHLAVDSGSCEMVQAVADWVEQLGSGRGSDSGVDSGAGARLGPALRWDEPCAGGLTPLHLAATLVVPRQPPGEETEETAPPRGRLNEAGLAALAWLLARFPSARGLWAALRDAHGSTPADLLGYYVAELPPDGEARVRAALEPLLGLDGMWPEQAASGGADRGRGAATTVAGAADEPDGWRPPGHAAEAGVFRALGAWVVSRLSASAAHWAAPAGALARRVRDRASAAEREMLCVLALFWGLVYVVAYLSALREEEL